MKYILILITSLLSFGIYGQSTAEHSLNRALQFCNKAVELNPKKDTVYYQRANIKFMLKDFNGSIKDYNKAIELNSKYIDAYYSRGISKYKLGDKEGACLDWKNTLLLGDTILAKEEISRYCK